MATSAPISVNTNSSVSNGGLNFDSILPFVIDRFIALIVSAIIVMAGVFVMQMLKRYIRRMETEHEQQKTALNLVEKLVTGFVIVITVTLALKNMGIDMSLLVSVTILGLSYGLQDVIKNYVAGILIMFKSPFKIGDTIKIKDFVGKVETVDFQSTGIRTFDRRHVTVHNSDVMTSAIINYSTSGVRRLDLDVTVGYGTDISEAIRVFNKILDDNVEILKSPAHRIVFKKFTPNGIIFSLRSWYKRPCNVLKLRSDLALQIQGSFDESKVYMPYEKQVQIESDYTMNEGRASRISKYSEANGGLTSNPLPEGLVPEFVDFEEEM